MLSRLKQFLGAMNGTAQSIFAPLGPFGTGSPHLFQPSAICCQHSLPQQQLQAMHEEGVRQLALYCGKSESSELLSAGQKATGSLSESPAYQALSKPHLLGNDG